MRSVRSASRRSGFTILEVVLAAAILAILVAKGGMLLSSSVEQANEVNVEIEVEDHARRVLKQIAQAVMSSDRQSLNPTSAAPLDSDDIRYRVQLGIEDGEVVWTDPEEIAFEEDRLQVQWSQNPDTESERRVVWTSMVSPYLEGEIPNGMDDNGNGLIDEKGLSFVVDRDAVTIRLTLARVVEGREITKTIETVVTCRNLDQPGL